MLRVDSIWPHGSGFEEPLGSEECIVLKNIRKTSALMWWKCPHVVSSCGGEASIISREPPQWRWTAGQTDRETDRQRAREMDT